MQAFVEKTGMEKHTGKCRFFQQKSGENKNKKSG
jgi:hypothetical protein